MKHLTRKIAAWLAALMMLTTALPYASAASVQNVSVRSAPMTAASQATNGMVRVYLSSLGNPSVLNLTINGKYSLSSTGEFLPSGAQMTVRFNSSTGALTLEWNGQKLGMGKKFSLRRHSTTGTNGILIAQSRNSENPYPGDLSFEVVSNGSSYTLYTIAHVYIETYLYGVLPYEMGNSSPIEALKAQAVAARTYTVRMMKQRASGRYDVKDTTSDQTYRGTPSGNANCVSAVDGTRGIVLMYGSNYITTYYSSSNGGQTEIARTGTPYAYMTVKDDPFDFANTSSTVKRKRIPSDLTSSATPSGLLSLLRSKAVQKLRNMGYPATESNTTLKTLKELSLHTPKYASPSRLYTKMDFTLGLTTQNASGQSVSLSQIVTCSVFDELESLLSLSLQSTANELWTVEETSSGFEVQARRYGHGMGMSQRGAMYMGKQGYSYDEILGFYYEGCKRVSHSFTNSILSGSTSDEEVTVQPPVDVEEDDAPSDPNALYAVVTTESGSLNLRASATTASRVLTTIPRNTRICVTQRGDSWCGVSYNGYDGYVMTSFLRFEEAEQPDETPDVPETNTLSARVTTQSGSLNLRSQPQSGSRILLRIPRNDLVTVLERGDNWCHVDYQGTVGYVMASFLTFGETALPTPPPTAPDNGEQSADSAVVTTASGALNLREEANADAAVLGTVPNGATVRVWQKGDTWCRVAYETLLGYVMTEYLSFGPPQEEDKPVETEPPAAETAQTAYVNTASGGLNLRQYPGSDQRVLTVIPRNAAVTVITEDATWAFVRYNGWEGYVMGSFLRFETVEAAPPDDDTGVPDESTAVTAWVNTNSGSLNLREAPNSNARILRTIPQYAQVKLLEEGNEWSYVAYAQDYGYVMSRYLSVQENIPAPPVSTQPDVEDEPEMPAGSIVHNGGMKLDITLALPPYAMYAVNATGEAIDLWLMCEENGLPVAELPAGAQAEVILLGETWCCVAYENVQGYCLVECLEVTE